MKIVNMLNRVSVRYILDTFNYKYEHEYLLKIKLGGNHYDNSKRYAWYYYG